jgi:hypothetical protein
MAVNAAVKEPDSPQIVLEKLANKVIDEEQARKILEVYFGKAESQSMVRKIIRAIFGETAGSAARR